MKWASCNVGANAPEEYGGYYAWGETEEKSDYTLSTYKYYDSSNGGWIKIGNDIKGTQYDVAHVKWGGSWRMPTKDEIKELLAECTSLWVTYKNVKGRKFTGPNGNSIFIPAAGWRAETDSHFQNEQGFYWSATLNSAFTNFAYDLGIGSGFAYRDDDFRRYGFTVRPVSE